jgi:hypothetical protein
MKIFAIPLFLLFTSCGTYHYMTPTINTAMYSEKGEVVSGLQFGSAGIAATGGLALSKNFNINGMASFFPETDNGYNSREVELSVGYQTPLGNKNAVASFFLGMGYGSNEYDKKLLSGSFNRPFLQTQFGGYDLKLFNSSIYIDIFGGMRLNYLLYNGDFEGAGLDDEVVYFEPYYGFAVGGQNVRFHAMLGVPIKADNWDMGVRVIPIFGNIGLQVKFRKR